MQQNTDKLRYVFNQFVFQTQSLQQMLFAKLNLPVTISFLARNAPLLSDIFAPNAELYNRALPSAYYTDGCSIRIQPKLNQCFAVRVARPPNLNDVQIALRQSMPGLSVERLAMRIAVCAVHRRGDLLKIKVVSNSCYFYYWKDAKTLQYLPTQSSSTGVTYSDAEDEELFVRSDIIDNFNFLMVEYTTLVNASQTAPDTKYEVCLGHSVCSLSENRFSSTEVPASQPELRTLFERIDECCLVNKYAALFKALKATEKRQMQELQSLSEAKKQSVFVWRSYALPVYKGSFMRHGERLEASSDKISKKPATYKFETLKLRINAVAFKDRNRLSRMPECAIIPSQQLRFLDHTAALVCNQCTSRFFGSGGLPGSEFAIALKFVRANDPPPFMLLKGVLHFRNSVALYAASARFRDMYMYSADYGRAQEITIEPAKYEYKCKLLLGDFQRFLQQSEALALANCGFVRPAGEWKAVAREWK